MQVAFLLAELSGVTAESILGLTAVERKGNDLCKERYAMVGKGSVNHNSRKFKAENVDADRSHLNIDYCNESIKRVYHELFDEALARYNAKQTRADRKIANYYEKIRSSKQEKPFHELILQIGDKENMSAESENGQLAKQVLDAYYRLSREKSTASERSAHLHLDEATPHLILCRLQRAKVDLIREYHSNKR